MTDIKKELADTANTLLAYAAGTEPFTTADLYAVDRVTGTQYMLSGGGPSTYATVFRLGTEVKVLVSAHGFGEQAHQVLIGYEAEQVAKVLENPKP